MHCVLNGAVTRHSGFFILKMFLIRKHFIQHAHIIASAGPRVGLHTFVGQMSSSKSLALKFLMVAIPNITMRVDMPRKDTMNTAMK